MYFHLCRIYTGDNSFSRVPSLLYILAMGSGDNNPDEMEVFILFYQNFNLTRMLLLFSISIHKFKNDHLSIFFRFYI